MKTTALDLLGVACLSLFAYAIWPPACLLIVGLGAIAYSWAESGYPRPRRRGDRS